MGDQSVGGRRLDLVDFDSKYDYNNARSSRGIVHDGVESLHLSVDHNGVNSSASSSTSTYRTSKGVSTSGGYLFTEKQLREFTTKEGLSRQGGGGLLMKETSSSEEMPLVGLRGEMMMEPSTRKRKLLTADEKTKQNRDRNRDHAKNTRLRKKAYVIKLKELVDQLTEQKAKEELELRAVGERTQEMHVFRKNAVRVFLRYRAANLTDYEKWSEVLDEHFVLTLPITPYRSFHKAEIVNSCRILRGIGATIADNCSLALMVEGLGWGSPEWRQAIKLGKRCSVSYSTTSEDLLAAGDLIMCKYLMSTEGDAEVGVTGGPVLQHGMMQCKFNKENKIVSAEMVFDVMGFMQQLQRASSISPESSIVPNTLEMALQPTREARAIFRAMPPYHVAIHVNEAWTVMMGHSQSEAEAVSLNKILGVDSSQYALMQNLSRDVSHGRPGSVIVISGTEAMQKSLLYVKMFPLTGDTDVITHFLVVVCDLPLSASEQASLFVHSNQRLTSQRSNSEEESISQSLNFPIGQPSKPLHFNYYPVISSSSTVARPMSVSQSDSGGGGKGSSYR